jgi:hypothetical protein
VRRSDGVHLAGQAEMTLELLEKHGIREFAKAGYGDQLTQSRLEKRPAHLVAGSREHPVQCARLVNPAYQHSFTLP